ncbi:MAG TPA: thiamine phosphate synthase [Rhodanobacteraceae bacterium]|jgi:thiamine-phosphate pyrophosphorylase|nr:thiamine phosphate synthase [Rhodanobacteraceae bacterium]
MPHPLLPGRRGLYAITDGPRADLLAACEAALDGGAALLQYRDKTRDRKRRLDEASALAALSARYGVPFVVNDDVDLARATRAEGVHLGEGDTDVATARARLGASAIIGVSCYDSLDRARALAAAGADYLALGAFFPSPTKPDARRATPALLREAKAFGLPLVAIGGITPENGVMLVEAGADYLAVISSVFGAEDVAAAARAFSSLFPATRS